MFFLSHSHLIGGSFKDSYHRSLQKSNAWNMITLSAQDQLRQRMAWALSQILVVTPKQINEDGLTEAYLNFYDIFVRNAFRNYRDVLKEVSMSPMMAEMLSFLESKSSGRYNHRITFECIGYLFQKYSFLQRMSSERQVLLQDRMRTLHNKSCNSFRLASIS